MHEQQPQETCNHLNHKQSYGGTQHMETARIFKTANRRLEGFLYAHRIRFFEQKKNGDGLTEWYYIVTPQFKKVYQEYRELWDGDRCIKSDV